jgi:hypothetical protein
LQPRERRRVSLQTDQSLKTNLYNNAVTALLSIWCGNVDSNSNPFPGLVPEACTAVVGVALRS